MSMKHVQKLMEKLEDALQDVEIDLDTAVEERDDYEFQLSEKTEAPCTHGRGAAPPLQTDL